MPDLNTSLLSAPLGFTQACKELNNIIANGNNFEEIGLKTCVAVIKSAPLPHGASNELQSINALAYIYRAIIQSKVQEPKELALYLLGCTLLSKNTIESVVKIYFKANENPSDAPSVKVGELVDFSWKIGVATQSKHCSDLKHPFIACSFGVKDWKGNVTHHPTEMSYAEFQNLINTVREVALELDT